MASVPRSLSAAASPSGKDSVSDFGAVDNDYHGFDVHMGKLSQISLSLVIAIACLAAVITAYIAYWTFDVASPIEFISAYTVRDTFAPMAPMTAYYKVAVKKDIPSECEATAGGKWIDFAGFGWPLGTAELSYARGENEIGLGHTVPMKAAAGASRIVATLTWSCDPLHLFRHMGPMLPLTVYVQR